MEERIFALSFWTILRRIFKGLTISFLLAFISQGDSLRLLQLIQMFCMSLLPLTDQLQTIQNLFGESQGQFRRAGSANVEMCLQVHRRVQSKPLLKSQFNFRQAIRYVKLVASPEYRTIQSGLPIHKSFI